MGGSKSMHAHWNYLICMRFIQINTVNSFFFKVPITTWRFPPDHILLQTEYWMPMPTGNGENLQFYGQGTVEDSLNWLCAKSVTRQRRLSAWIPGLLTLKVQGSLPHIEVNGRTVGTFRVVCYIVSVHCWGVSVKQGSTVHTSSLLSYTHISPCVHNWSLKSVCTHLLPVYAHSTPFIYAHLGQLWKPERRNAEQK